MQRNALSFATFLSSTVEFKETVDCIIKFPDLRLDKFVVIAHCPKVLPLFKLNRIST